MYRTEAIVIGRFDLGETDRIFTLYTPSRGKMRAIAKGVRRPQSRLAPHLEILSQSRLILAKGRDLDVVTSAETVDAHWPLRTDLDAFGYASYLCELLNQMTEDNQESPQIYGLLSNSLRLISEGVSAFSVTRQYELALLSSLGYRPELYRCMGCGKEIAAEENALSARQGGMICQDCRSADLSALPLSVNAQKFIRMLDRGQLAAAAQMTIDAATAAEIERAMLAYARNHAERDSRSLGVIRAIHEWRPEYDAGN